MRTEDFLRPVVREVRAVALPRRGSIAHVRALLASEAMALSDAIGAAETSEDTIAVQLAAFACDEAGNAVLTAEQARESISRLYLEDVRAIVTAGQTLNLPSDQAVEDTRKNS